MELIIKPDERERIEKIYKESDLNIFSSEPDKMYSIVFKITNPALANYIIPMMLYRPEKFDIGITVQSINLDLPPSSTDLRTRLHEAIDAAFDDRGE